MTPELLAKYDGLRVPRYTSYPTAPHFSPAVGADRYLEWLGALAPGTEVSLYLHVPFCHVMCWYCGCHTKYLARYEPATEYLAALEREIALVAATVAGRLRISHLHWGGGTPNFLAAADFARIMDAIRARFDFLPAAELAVEIDPRTLQPDQVQAMAESGINRASLGVQDFDPEVQRTVNRIQPFEMTAAAVEMFRAAGVQAINLDLMYGLPGQTVEGCRHTAEQALTLEPSRLAVFGYAHVPWMKKHQRLIDEQALPDGPERWRQFGAIAAALTAGGMQPIGLDHFAHPQDSLAVAQRAGRMRRNFQGYTDDQSEVLLGFGASAIGATPQGYVQNAPALEQYAEAVTNGRPAVARGLVLSDDDRLRRDLIERLMCDMTVDAGAIAQRHGLPAAHFDAVIAGLTGLAEDGVVVVDGRRLTVPEAARPMMRAVAAAFDTYLAASQSGGVARHSRAI